MAKEQHNEIRNNTSLLNLQQLKFLYGLDNFWKKKMHSLPGEGTFEKESFSSLAQATISLWKKFGKEKQAWNLANRFSSFSMVHTLASIDMEKEAIKMLDYLSSGERTAAAVFLSQFLRKKKYVNFARVAASEELSYNYSAPSWEDRYGNIKTRTALRVAFEKTKPITEQDSHLIADNIRFGCREYCHPDDCIARVGLQEAGYLFYELALLDGTDKAIEQANQIKYSSIRTLAFLGIIKATAVKGEEYPPISLDVDNIKNMAFGDDLEIIESFILNNIPLFIGGNNYQSYLDNILNLSLACEPRTECQDLRKLYWKTVAAKFLNQTNSEKKKQLADQWLNESDQYLTNLKLNELHKVKFFGVISVFSLEIEKILLAMGIRQESLISQFIAQTDLIPKQASMKSLDYDQLAEIAMETGQWEIASEVAKKIDNEMMRYKIQVNLLLHEQNKISAKKIREATIFDLEKISTNGVQAIEQAGYYSKIDLDQVLSNQNINAEFKLSFLLGRSRAEAKKNGARKSIYKGIEWLKLHPEMEPSIDILVDLLLSVHDYQTTSWFLFELINHRRNTNYLIDVPNTIYLETVIRNLIKIGNNKGLSIAANLFANEQVILLKPQLNQELFSLLLANNYWPGVDQKFITAQIRGDGSKEQLLINSLRYLLRRYNLAPSREFLENLNIFNNKNFEEVKKRLDSLYEASLRFNVELNPIERCRQLVIEGDDSQLAYYLFNSGKDIMSHVAHYPFDVFQKIIIAVANVQIDSQKLTQLYQHLLNNGENGATAQAIMDNLVLGLYPFGEANRVRQLIGKQDWENDMAIFEKQLDSLLKKLLPAELIDKLFNGQKLNFTLLRENFTKKNEKWRSRFWERIESLRNAGIKAELKYDINSVFDQLEYIENQIKRSVSTGGRYMIEVVEKGRDLFKFIGAVNAVPSCVNTDNAKNHLEYMPWRLAEPTALTLAITDLQSGQITGNLEMRLGTNNKNGEFELFIVGIYSSGKSQTMVDSVMEFIEQSIALPLRIKAINIASKYGGEIPKPIGYKNVPKLKATGFSSVIDQSGQPLLTRGDDIINEYNYTTGSLVNKGVDFTFAGYRKELK